MAGRAGSVRVVTHEAQAWCPCRFVACNLVLEYTLSASVCARAVTAYGATLLGLAPGDALLSLGALRVDFFAVGLSALLGLLLCLGTKESSSFNTGKATKPHPLGSKVWRCSMLMCAVWLGRGAD